MYFFVHNLTGIIVALTLKITSIYKVKKDKKVKDNERFRH